MCFTINIHTTRDAIGKRFGVDTSLMYDFDFRYVYRAFENPLIPVITQQDPEYVQLFTWGLIPHWARNERQAETIRKGTYNARAESLEDKPSFREPVARQRCLVITSGFYEWQDVSGQKIPWFIHHRDQQLMTMAGIFDTWQATTGKKTIATFSVVTTRANPLMEKIHNTKKRMPVILDQKSGNDWIRDDLTPGEREQLLQPADQATLKAYTISKKISSRETDPDDPDVITPCDYHTDGSLF